jgi:hypothetical protein
MSFRVAVLRHKHNVILRINLIMSRVKSCAITAKLNEQDKANYYIYFLFLKLETGKGNVKLSLCLTN